MERESLTAEIKILDTQIGEYHKKTNKLDREKSNKTDIERICDEQSEIIKELEKRREQLGFFKGKEKKVLQEQIEQEKGKLSSMKEQAETERKAHRKEIDRQIDALNIQKNELEKKRNDLEKKCSAIEKELTKDRE